MAEKKKWAAPCCVMDCLSSTSDGFLRRFTVAFEHANVRRKRDWMRMIS